MLVRELATVIPQACGDVWAFIRSSHLPQPGRNLAVYLAGEGHLECGVEVAQPFAGSEEVVCSSTPAGLVAMAVHLGPYDRPPEAHVAIRRWYTAHGYVLTGRCMGIGMMTPRSFALMCIISCSPSTSRPCSILVQRE